MRASLFALVAFILAASPVRAQETQTVEFTPYLAVGSSGASPFGAAITISLTPTLSLETDVAYRHGEGIHALSTSGSLLYSLPRVGQSTPYVAGGLGLSQYGSPVFSPMGVPIGSQSRVAVTLNAGGGVKTPVRKKLDLRTDVRYYKSFGREGSEAFRVAEGISFHAGKR